MPEGSIVEELLERTRYMGKYLAIVKDIDDPDKMRRIMVQCPVLAEDKELPWALPCDSIKRDWLPEIDDIVWIEFEQGYNIERPIWVGLAVAKDDVDTDFLAEYGSAYRKDRDYNGNQIEWKPDGLVITDVNGNVIETKTTGIIIEDVNGNIVEIGVAGVKFKTGDSSAWAPCTIQNCIFSGAPHGGTPAGITRLRGE